MVAASILLDPAGAARPALTRQGPFTIDTRRRTSSISGLGTLPLVYQPGERWLYHTGSEVLGMLVARVAAASR